MSDAAHTVPGQSILERLYARGVVRPSIGATSAFYERFGLSDPWTEFRGWGQDESESDGLFYFLSAAPYYARLRAQRQRAWRVRRRLMMRLSDPAKHVVGNRALARLAGPSAVSSAWLEGAPTRTARIAYAGSASELVVLSTAAPEEEESEETTGRRAERSERGRWRDRRGWTRPRATTVARREAARAVPTVLEEVLRVASGPTRRLIVRVMQDVASLPPEEQVIVARRVTRDLRGPAARMVRAALADAEIDVADTPVRAAAERAEPPRRRRRGLRPMLSSSPAMQALAFEELETPEGAPAEPVRRRPVSVPAPREPSAHREVPEARVAREVRTQRVTGRAGPEVAEAAIAAAPVPARRRPTERVALLSRETRAVATSEPEIRRTDVRYGLDAVRPERAVGRATRRMAARAVSVSAVDSRGERLLSPSPTGFIRREARRTIRIVAPEAALPGIIEQLEVEAEAPLARRPGRGEPVPSRPSEPEREGALRRAAERGLPGTEPTATRPQVEGQRESGAPVERTRRSRRIAAEGRLAQPAVESEAVESARARRRRVEHRPQPGAAMRAAARVDAARPEPEAGRIALAVRPTSYLDTFVEPVGEPTVEPVDEASSRRYGRPSVRAAARAERVARTDTRGVAVLATGATDYLAVARASEAEGPLSRSPLGFVERTRRMRGATVDTGAVLRPAEAEAEVEEQAPRRRAPAATERAAQRLDAGRRILPATPAEVGRQPTPDVPRVSAEARAEAAPRRARVPGIDMVVPVVEPMEEEPTPAEQAGRAPRRRRVPAATVRAAAERADAPTRASILVRDARGRVRPSRRVTTGAAAYASARLIAQATEEIRSAVGTERARRQATTALERSAAPRRQGLPRVMPHTIVGDDFRWLVPEVEVPPEAPAAPGAPRVRAVTERPATPEGRAPRVVAERRVTGAGTVSRQRLAEVLSRVSAVVRAVDRADEPRVLLPATRRTLEGARVTAEPRARRLPTGAGEGIVLRIVLEEEEPTSVARAEQRATLRVRGPGEAPAPEAVPLRRAFAGAEGVDARPLERLATRADRTPTARPERRATARTRRGVDDRYVPSRRRAGERPTAAYGRGRPGLARGRRLPTVDAGGVVRPQAPESQEEGAPRIARPLGSTLDYVGTEQRPMRRGAVDMQSLAGAGAPSDDEEQPAWAQRAVRGTAARRRRRPEGPGDETPQTVRTPIRGDLFTALARASRPEDVVQVILERGRTLRSETRGLPDPAVRLVERIARVQEEDGATRQPTAAPEGELLGRGRRAHRHAASSAVSTTSLPRSAGGVAPATVRRVTSLADKLMELIHLAEVERRVTDAQRQARLAADTAEARAEAGHGDTGAGKPGAAPNLKQLESDVLAAVIRELDLMKIRRQEDFSDVWW